MPLARRRVRARASALVLVQQRRLPALERTPLQEHARARMQART
jgi:hypothetical protein